MTETPRSGNPRSGRDPMGAERNIQATIEKVVLEARRAYGEFEQAAEALTLASEMVRARRDAEGTSGGAASTATAKAATAKAELEYLHAEATYRVAHAKLVGAIGAEEHPD